MICRRSQPVRLDRYNPLWGVVFGIEKAWLWLNLHAHILGIAHVGSTAIPGMPAKPVIDISVAIADYDQAWELVEALKGFGYRYLGGNSELREYSFEKNAHTLVCYSSASLAERNGKRASAFVITCVLIRTPTTSMLS